MGLIILIPLIGLILVTWLSYVLANKIYMNLVSSGNKSANAWRTVSFIVIFSILAVVTVFLFFTAVPLGRQ